MNSIRTAQPVDRFISGASGFLSGGRFPAFAICALVFYQVFIAVMAFVPPTGGAWGDFLQDFRMRCFKFDPKSGWMEMSPVWVLLSEPLPLLAMFYFIWRTPLHELSETRRRAFAQAACCALLLVSLIGFSLMGLGRSQATSTELPFPAVNLRSALVMPSFTLTNQEGHAVSLADFKGRVVLVTAVYSTCTTTCPMMLTKVRAVLDQLTPAEHNDMAVVAFSLNPEADTLELGGMIAKSYGMKAEFHFVNGVPSEVNAVLDTLNVARTRDEKSGQIMHSNLFFLLDREGRIAYRLSLSQNEASWLISALRVLLVEKSS
ncbi:MAG: SCO family protein [Pedosphaera sp.]|nr:SCO family protein [Pedosphaera sp.]